MRPEMRAGAMILALLATVGIAAAQTGASSTGGAQAKASLTPSQEETLKKGLAVEHTVSAPEGFQPEIGKKLPASLTPQALPPNVETQVPEAKSFLYVKLPDSVLLIDPSTQQIAQVIELSKSTTGSDGPMNKGGNPSGSGSPDASNPK